MHLSVKSSDVRILGPALFLLSALLIMILLLLPARAYKAPRQEFENNEVKESQIIFSRPSGFYEDPFTLQINAPSTEIYYTLDGTDPVRGQEGTFKYTRKGIEITDASSSDNVHSARTDVTTGFDQEAVENLSKGEKNMHYKVPEEPVDKCTILRAVFYDMNGKRSDVQTGVWFVGFNGRKGYGTAKVVSIVTDPENLFGYESGIYVTGKTFDEFAAADSFHDESIWYRQTWWWWDANYNRRGRDWERPASVLFFSEDGDLLLQQQAGIRIQGGGSRGFLPKSLNLYSRKDYDGNSRFHYDFFGTGFEAKRLTLTSGGDDFYTKQKDRLVADLAADRDFSVMHYEPCIVFLDGEYWGFYFLTEKYDDKYFSYYYDVPEEEVLEIKNNKVEVGTEDDLALYEELRSFIEENDMSDEENYAKACDLMDMDSFINYYAALIYCGRVGDWPNGNFALWRTRPAPVTEETAGETAAEDSVQEDSPWADGRWRWILFDVNSAAISPNLIEHDTLGYVLDNKSMPLFKCLSANPDFRRQFSERILEYGQTIFSPESVNKRLDEYAEEMTLPMECHFLRFFGEDSGLDFTEITDTEIRDFFASRYRYVEKSVEEHFGLPE